MALSSVLTPVCGRERGREREREGEREKRRKIMYVQ